MSKLKEKKCNSCKEVKIINNFGKFKSNPDGLYNYCKSCRHKWDNQWRNTPKGIYQSIERRAKLAKRNICSEKDFIEWYKTTEETIERCCSYCDIPEPLIKKILLKFNSNGFLNKKRLEIDRIDNTKGYIIDNMTLACPICNFTKNEIFDYEEMKIIGKTIKNKWKKILGSELA